MSQQQQPQPNDSTGRLFNILGDDVAKALLADGPTKTVMQKALEEMQDEQIKANVEKGKEKIRAVIAAQKEINSIKKEFANKLKASEKKLNKLLGPLQALMTGRPMPNENENKEDGENEEETVA